MAPAPDSAAPAATDQTVAEIIRSRQHLPGALLPILHGIQDALGHVPPEVVPDIAQALNLSRAEVHGVVSYYHHFRSAPAGAQVLQVCRAEACQAMGAQALWQHACTRLGLQAAGTTADGAVTIDGEKADGTGFRVTQAAFVLTTPITDTLRLRTSLFTDIPPLGANRQALGGTTLGLAKTWL